MLLLLTQAFAGDACPISVQYATYTPEWRQRTTDLSALKTQATLFGVTYRTRSGGLHITKLVPHTQAAERLKVGDRLVSIDGRPIASKQDFNDALDAAGTGVAAFTVERDGNEVKANVGPSPVDPLVKAMFTATRKTECRDVTYAALDEAQQKALAAAAFDVNKGFHCTDTHSRLKASFEQGTIVAIRGGRRVLLTMPGWASTCVTVEETDGDELSAAAAKAVQTLTKGYVKDRHDNP